MAGNNLKTDFIWNLDDKQMVAALNRLNEKLTGFNDTLDGIGGKAVVLNQAFELFDKGRSAVVSLVDSAREGAASKGVFTAFGTQMNKLGMTAEEGLGKYRSAVTGTVEDLTLLQVANKGLISGLDPDLIATTLEYVTKYTKTNGGDAAALLNTTLTGLTRGSTEFLDDVGIIISQTQVVNEKQKEWGRTLSDAEKKMVVLAAAQKQMNEKMSDFDDLADNQSEKIERLIARLKNWKMVLAEFSADVVVPAGLDEKRSASMFNSLDAELVYYQKLLAQQKKVNADTAVIEKTQARIEEIQTQKANKQRDYARLMLSGGTVKSAEKYNKDRKTNAELLAGAELESSTAGLTAYQKELKKIQDTYKSMAKYTPDLKKAADEYLKTAKANLDKDAALKKDKKVEREAERLKKEIDRKEIQLTRENEKIKGEIKSAALNDYGDDRLAIEKKYLEGEIKAHAEFEADKEEIAKYHSGKLDKLAKEKFDNEMKRLGVQKATEIDAWARKRAEEQRELDWQTKMADMDLKYQQGIAALDLRKTTRDNKASYDDRFRDEYTQQLNALSRKRDEKFLETGSWDAAEGWYEQEKAALDYAAAIGMVSQNLTNFSKITNQDVKGAFEALESPLSTFIESMGEGKFRFGELISGIEDQLKIYAAGKTAHFLMEAAYSGYMGLIKSMNPLTAWEAPLWYSQSSQYLSSAAVMGSFVTGMGLAGMAHDGIDYIPKTGTWLIEEGERITDKRTNADLKSFLANPAMGGVNVSLGDVVINGGDEQGVLKALPQLEKTLTDAMIKAVTNNAKLKTAIKTYAR